MNAGDIRLYSFGTAVSPDITIPQSIANAMGFAYSPIVLDDSYMKTSYIDCAEATAVFSDGYRSVHRAHYYYAMQKMADEFGVIVSGICGSNVMKSAANSPSVVMNQRILDIISGGEPLNSIQKHFYELCGIFPTIFTKKGFDEFAESVQSTQMSEVLAEPVYSKRMSRFIFTYLERRYFGTELASYKHLMTNYSPFINIRFIEALSRTEHFNANRSSKCLFSNWSNGVLYAKLINRKNPDLAKFMSDKHVSLRELLNPLNFPLIAAKQVYRRRIRKHIKNTDYYNTNKATELFLASNPELEHSHGFKSSRDRNMNGSLLSALYWHENLVNGNKGGLDT
jgi:hypothetical protein